MNWLITGSTGFLGKCILKEFGKVYNLFTLSRSNAHFVCDLSCQIPNLTPVDFVIHTAGKAHLVPKTEFEKKAFFDVNVTGTVNLLEGLEISKSFPKAFVYISSVSVYGVDSGHNISEDHPLLAHDSYGLSKIEAEHIVLEWCKKNKVICTILRLPLLVGPNPSGNLRAMINAIRNGFYFNVSGGSARKSMVLASDISKFLLAAAEVGGIYNLTDGYHPKFNELSHLISKQLGKRFVPSMPLFVAKILAFLGDKIGPLFPINSDKLNKITSTLTFNDSKARKAFGWNPTSVLKGFNIHE